MRRLGEPPEDRTPGTGCSRRLGPAGPAGLEVSDAHQNERALVERVESLAPHRSLLRKRILKLSIRRKRSIKLGYPYRFDMGFDGVS